MNLKPLGLPSEHDGNVREACCNWCRAESWELNETREGLLCDDCLYKYIEQQREGEREKRLQDALNETPSDEIISLQFSVSLMYEKLDSKEGTENLTLWTNRIRIALESKKS